MCVCGWVCVCVCASTTTASGGYLCGCVCVSHRFGWLFAVLLCVSVRRYHYRLRRLHVCVCVWPDVFVGFGECVFLRTDPKQSMSIDRPNIARSVVPRRATPRHGLRWFCSEFCVFYSIYSYDGPLRSKKRQLRYAPAPSIAAGAQRSSGPVSPAP